MELKLCRMRGDPRWRRETSSIKLFYQSQSLHKPTVSDKFQLPNSLKERRTIVRIQKTGGRAHKNNRVMVKPYPPSLMPTEILIY